MSSFWLHLNNFYAQASAGGGLDDLLATYGPFAPFAALLLWLLKLLWADNKAKEEEIRALTSTAMEKVIPLVLEATSVLASAVSALNSLKENDQDTRLLSQRVDDLLLAIEDLNSTLRVLEKRTKRNSDG